jgi:tripartite-type tricarboxylate transporter receptor subunit TctC
MIGKTRIALIGAALGVTAMFAAPAKAQEFDFAGKQIKIVIGFGVGGTYGKYAQMFAEYLQPHLPGKPTIIVESRPGAGGILAANYAAQAMPANGLNYLVPPDSSVIVQLMQPNKAKYDMRKFTSIGTANQTNVIVVTRTDSEVTKWEDLKTKAIPMGTSGLGSTAYIIPSLMNGLLGTKMKIVSGYKGSNKTGLAVEQGEVSGAAYNWLFWKSGFGRWFEGDKPFANAILQVGLWPDPELPNVPMLKDLVSPADKPIVDFVGALGLIGRGLAAPPGTPEAAIKTMRAAWEKMIVDPAFIADAKKRQLRVIPATGEEVQAAINTAVESAKPELVARASELVYGKKK